MYLQNIVGETGIKRCYVNELTMLQPHCTTVDVLLAHSAEAISIESRIRL